MAAGAQSGSVCGHSNPVDVKDGTLCLAVSPQPWALGAATSVWTSVKASVGSDYEWVKVKVQAGVSHLPRGIRTDLIGALCIFRACEGAEGYAGEAILDETGYQIKSLVANLLPGLLITFGVVGGTTIVGAGIGVLVANVAGAVVGADLGFDIGMAALAWLGIGFLLKAMVEGLGEMTEAVEKGIETAWQARNLSGTAKKEQVDRASRELGKAAGILVRLILQGIVAYLLKKVAVKSTRGAATTVRLIQKEGAAVAADTTIAGLVAKLRASRFGDAFADWIEKNWHDLIRNPRLGGGKGAVQVTAQMIREAMKDAPLRSQQKGGVSLPRVQQFVDRLLGGEQPPPIKVDGNMLVDGNHRYIAARILGEESPIQPWAGGRPTEAIPWNEIPIDPKFW